jgi:ElaB/YqjD/DUF883 family membrane-anchored ribosome-binding protein
MSAPSVRASAVRKLADTSRDLLNEAKTLMDKSASAAPDEKALLEEQAKESLAKAKAIAQSAIDLAK